MGNVLLRSYEQPKIVVLNPGDGVTTSVAIDASTLSLSIERPAIGSGFFAATVGTQTRVLPRAKLTAVTDTASNIINCDCYQVFIPGDEISIIEPFATLTPSLYALGETYNIILDGVKASISIPADLTSDVGVFLAEAIGLTLLKNKVYAISNSPDFNTIWVFSKDYSATYTLQTEDVNAIGTFIENTTIQAAAAPIGTVQALNTQTGEIFLTAVATAVYEPGVKIGLPVSALLGLMHEDYSFRRGGTTNVGLTTSNTVFTELLPYFDEEIKETFNNLYFR